MHFTSSRREPPSRGGFVLGGEIAAAGVAAAEFRGAFAGYLRLMEKYRIYPIKISV